MKPIALEDLAELGLLALSFAPGAIALGGVGERIRRFVGALDDIAGPGRRRTLEERVSHAFQGKLNPDEVRRLGRSIVENRWNARETFWLRALANLPANRERVGRGIRVEGREHFDAAIRRKRGVILWESHFGNRVVLKLALAREGISIMQVHGPGHGGSQSRFGQRVMQPLHRSMERRLVDNMVVMQEAPGYLRAVQNRLRENGVVVIPAVGNQGKRFIELDLLGHPQCLATGVVSMAAATGAALIPIFCFHDPACGFRLIFEEPVVMNPAAERLEQQIQALSQYIRVIEKYVRLFPRHWKSWGRVTAPEGAQIVRAGSCTNAATEPDAR